MFAIIGALAFLGLLRLSVGDAMGVLFLKSGNEMGRSRATHTAVEWIMPVMMGLLLLRLSAPEVSDSGAVFFSESGPGGAGWSG